MEGAGLKAKAQRKDIQVIRVRAIEAAIKLSGTSLHASLILLGAFIAATQTLPGELIREEIKNYFASNEEVQKMNAQTFEQGYSMIRNYG